MFIYVTCITMYVCVMYHNYMYIWHISTTECIVKHNVIKTFSCLWLDVPLTIIHNVTISHFNINKSTFYESM